MVDFPSKTPIRRASGKCQVMEQRVAPIASSFVTLAGFGFCSLIYMWSSHGGVGSKAARKAAAKDLAEHGFLYLPRKERGNQINESQMYINREGFSFIENGSRRNYRWGDVAKPFATRTEGSYKAFFAKGGFYIRKPNPKYGKKTLFSNSTREFVEEWHYIPSHYGLGWTGFFAILNDLRTNAPNSGINKTVA